MIRFKDLKTIIVRNCRTLDNKNDPSDINNRFNFTINVERLEKGLNAKSNLHVLAFGQNIVSRIPDMNDLQLISEYMQYKNKDIRTIFDGKSQIATFMLYLSDIEMEEDKKSDIEAMSSKQILDAVNNDDPDRSVVFKLLEDYPIYRTVVVRFFDKKKDKFVYSIYFRSNYNMISYINSLKHEGEFEEESEEPVDVIDEE